MNLTTAVMLAKTSDAVYQGPEQLDKRLGLHHIEAFDLEGLATAFVASNNQDVVLAFRGSLMPNEFLKSPAHFLNVLRDWSANLDWDLVSRPGWKGRVCQGFADCLEQHSQAEEIREELLRHGADHKRLWVTGHSLGGALAILQAHRLHNDGLPVTGVYTFGAPRTGNGAFVHDYGVPLFRFENKNDLVPWLPFYIITDELSELLEAITGGGGPENFPAFRHPGQLYFLSWWEQVTEATNSYLLRKLRELCRSLAYGFGGGASAIKDHSMKDYVRILEQNAKAASGGAYFRVSVKNTTSKTLLVAVHFSVDGQEWRTNSWYEFAPGEEALILGSETCTRNRHIYFYAHDKKGMEWKGDDYQETIDGRECEFFQIDMGEKCVPFTLTLK